jgi:hypothetical protein
MIDFNAARQMVAPTQPAAIPTLPADVALVSQDPMFILTPAATIAVYGHEHISKKMLEIFGLIMNLDEVSGGKNPVDHNVRSIIIRTDNQPKMADGKAIMAGQAYGFGSIAINLVETFRGTKRAIEEDALVSLHQLWHNNLIMDLLHEVHHMIMRDEPCLDEKVEKERDALAEEWAIQTRNFMAQNYNIEPLTFRDETFFHAEAMKALVEWQNGDDAAKEIYRLQNHMLINHVKLTIPADKALGLPEAYVTSFKKVMQLLLGIHLDAAEWNKPTDGESMNLEQFLMGLNRIQPTVTTVGGAPWDGDDEPGYSGDDVHTETRVLGPESAFMQNPSAFYTPPVNNAPPQPFTPASFAPANTWQTLTGQQNPLMNPTPAPAPLPNHGLSPDEVRTAAMSVYAKCYNHIFTHCGQLVNSDLAFSNSEAVSSMPIALTPAEAAVVYLMDAQTALGQPQKGMPTTEGLRGFTFSKSKLPVYMLYINDGTGKPTMRKLMPQNTANASKPGQAARAGSRIMYIVEADPAEERAMVARGESTFLYKVVDGQFMSCKG